MPVPSAQRHYSPRWVMRMQEQLLMRVSLVV